MSSLEHTYAVILAGGGGTRLWPKSRNQTPKQFLRLSGKRSMVQLSAARLSNFIGWDKIIVVTNKIYYEEVKNQLPDVPATNIICEPERRDTALAMLVGSLRAKSLDSDAVVVNAASDHVVVNEKEFTKVMKAAVWAARSGEHLVTVGITPTFPSTAFGYIRIGDDIDKINGLPVFQVQSFTEKPGQATARAFISTGKYFWNANMYVWHTDALIKAFEQHASATYNLAKDLINKKSAAFHQALPAIYKKAESISIDYAISEKSDNLVLIPGDFGWSDVGNWDVVYSLGKKDLAGNVIISDEDQAKALTINSSNNLIHTGKRLVAVVGIDDMIVVDTDEIVMVLPKSRSQDVKKIVERLAEEGKSEYL